MRFYTVANESDGKDPAWERLEYWIAIIEIVVVTFIVSLIPDLIVLGHIPNEWSELWEPFLSALLIAIYAYMRVRGIEVQKKAERDG